MECYPAPPRREGRFNNNKIDNITVYFFCMLSRQEASTLSTSSFTSSLPCWKSFFILSPVPLLAGPPAADAFPAGRVKWWVHFTI